MEDAYNRVHINRSDKQYQFFGVYDGHGGDEVSGYLQDTLPLLFANRIQTQTMVSTALKDVPHQVEQEIRQRDFPSGSTAVVAVFDDKNTLHIANIGDSRAVVIRNDEVVFRTKDHKPMSEFVLNKQAAMLYIGAYGVLMALLYHEP